MEPRATPWEFGWDALVALGTIGLALGTAVLAVASFVAARSASRDLRAQWRPVVVSAADVEVDYLADDELVQLTVRNVGQGAAYDLDPGLDLGEAIHPATLYVPHETELVNVAVLPVGESLDLSFTHIKKRPTTCEVVIDYRDLNGRPYASRIQIRDIPVVVDKGPWLEVLSMTSTRLFDGHQVVDWNNRWNYGRRRGDIKLRWLALKRGLQRKRRSAEGR